MMQVRVMRVGMAQPLMAVHMRMRLGHRSLMRMPVMFVMDMGVLMFQIAMSMLMLMPLRQMQPQAGGHQERGGE